jgi:hypothetical protein
VHNTDCKILISDYVFGCRIPVKPRCEWQKSNMSVRIWALNFKEERCNIGLAFMMRKQQECNLGELAICIFEQYISVVFINNHKYNCMHGHLV